MLIATLSSQACSGVTTQLLFWFERSLVQVIIIFLGCFYLALIIPIATKYYYYMNRTSYSINVHHGYVYQCVVRVQRSSLLNLDLDTRMYARRFSWRTGDVLEAQNCNLKKHFNLCFLLHLMWISLDLNVCRFR